MISRNKAIELRKTIFDSSCSNAIAKENAKKQCLSRIKYMAIDHGSSLNGFIKKPIYDELHKEWIPDSPEPWLMFVDFYPLGNTNNPKFEYPKNLTLIEIPTSF